jgi:hypothetical protein
MDRDKDKDKAHVLYRYLITWFIERIITIYVSN